VNAPTLRKHKGKDGLTGPQRRRARHKAGREIARKQVGIFVVYTSGRTRTWPIPVSEVPVVQRPKALSHHTENPLVKSAQILPL
jgi:hypothetical protein